MSELIMKYIIVILLFTFFSLPSNSQKISELNLIKINELLKTNIENFTSGLDLPDDTFLNISEYLSKYGYPFQSHEVVTEDGFVLTLHRIPPSNQTGANNNKAVLFVPPLLCSSIDWVNIGPNTSLALLMYDLQGFDVWLLNPRGTRYSMTHQTLNSSQELFWNFSFHEKGFYDVARGIDYVLDTTSLEQVTVIGYSEGTSASMALAATRPEYNDKIKLMVLLSPIGYMGGVISPIPVYLTKYLNELEALAYLLKFYGLPYIEEIGELLVAVCSIEGFGRICRDVLGLFMGFDNDELDLDHMLVMLADKPSGVSVKQLLHYGQEIVSASFRQYDYGADENLIHYGTEEPPAYNPANITAPVAAYYGKNDYFASVSDVEKLLNELPNVAEGHLIEYDKFSHLDFMAAINVRTLLYDKILSLIEQYN